MTLKLAFKQTNLADRLRRVDWVGSLLFVSSTTSFLIPITWGGVSYAWDSWHTLVPLIIGIIGLILFVAFEEHVAKEPLIRLDVFQNRTNAASYVETILHGMILWCILYYLPLYYETVKGQSPITAGVSCFPETFTVAPAAVITGISISKTGRYRWAIWSGWLLTVLGTGLLCYLKVDTPTVAWIFFNLVSGLGMGMIFPAISYSIQAATPNKDLAFAVGLYTFFQAFGQAIGVAIGGTIFQNEMKKKLLAYPSLALHAEQYAADASGLVQVIKKMEAGEMKIQLIQSYNDSLQVVWAVMTGLAFLGLLSSFLVEGIALDRVLETEQGMVRPRRYEIKDVEQERLMRGFDSLTELERR